MTKLLKYWRYCAAKGRNTAGIMSVEPKEGGFVQFDISKQLTAVALHKVYMRLFEFPFCSLVQIFRKLYRIDLIEIFLLSIDHRSKIRSGFDEDSKPVKQTKASDDLLFDRMWRRNLTGFGPPRNGFIGEKASKHKVKVSQPYWSRLLEIIPLMAQATSPAKIRENTIKTAIKARSTQNGMTYASKATVRKQKIQNGITGIIV